VDLKRESDIEQLRRIAVAQQTQIEQLLRLLASQAAELGALKGNEAELQQKLALIEELTRQSAELARETEDAPVAQLPAEPKARKPRTAFGNTAQPRCRSSSRPSRSTPRTLHVRAAAACLPR
jgi:hypothetical protein